MPILLLGIMSADDVPLSSNSLIIKFMYIVMSTFCVLNIWILSILVLVACSQITIASFIDPLLTF